MNNPGKQVERVRKIREEARASTDYKIESAKIDFSEQICQRLEALGLSRTDLADRMGVSTPYITKILRGTANLTLDSMVRIADALDCDCVPAIRPRKRPGTTGHPRTGPASRSPKRTFQKTKRPARAMVHEAPSSYGKKREGSS